MRSRYAVAPEPSGSPGVPAGDQEVEAYLQELGRWRLRREHELMAIDASTRTHDGREVLNAHVTESMKLWHAVAQRHDLLLSTWDHGNTSPETRLILNQLIWGLLEQPDGNAESIALSVPEATRLSDYLAVALRAQVGIDDDLTDPQERIDSLREGLERLREHARTVEPQRQEETEGVLSELEGRLTKVHERLVEGENVTVQLGALQTELAIVERRLLLTDAKARHDRADPEQVAAEREELLARGEAVRSLAQRALETINPAPRLGIPDAAALGEVPTDKDALTTYIGNLERISRALDQAHNTYAAALAEYADLASRAQKLAQTLAGCGAPTSVDLAGMLTAAKESLNNRPADIHRAAALVAAQEAYLAELRPDA
jgi:hypothetical protein